MSAYTFELPFRSIYISLVRMLLPLSVVYMVLLLVPILDSFQMMLDFFLTLKVPQDYAQVTLIALIALFVAFTLIFFVFVIPLLIAGIFRLLCPSTEIRATGIIGSTAYGNSPKLIWNEILAVEPVKKFGLKYLKVLSKNDPPLWIPLFYEDIDILAEAVMTFAPQSSPLRQFFEEPTQPAVFKGR